MMSSYREAGTETTCIRKIIRVQEMYNDCKWKKIMKKISLDELANLMGGDTYSSCTEVQVAATTHETPPDLSDDGKQVEEQWWDEWCKEFDRLCGKRDN